MPQWNARNTSIDALSSILFPDAPGFSPSLNDAEPARAWVMPATLPRRGYTRACVALPPGMPDCLEVSVVRSIEGTERTTAAVYGARVYLIHYEFKPN